MEDRYSSWRTKASSTMIYLYYTTVIRARKIGDFKDVIGEAGIETMRSQDTELADQYIYYNTTMSQEE